MKKALFAALLFSLALAACGRRDKFAALRDFGGTIEITQWPKMPAGVAGYHLYMSPEQNGEYTKITEEPAGWGKIMIPKLEYDKDYWFKLSYVMKDGREGKPGGAFKRKSSAAPK